GAMPTIRRGLAPNALPRSRAVIDRGCTGLTIGIGATVGWVGEDPIRGGITRPVPNDVTVESTRQSQPVFKNPQQRLSPTDDFREFAENQSNRLLHSSIGVFFKLDLSSLQVTDWSGYDQLAAPHFLLSRCKRALT